MNTRADVSGVPLTGTTVATGVVSDAPESTPPEPRAVSVSVRAHRGDLASLSGAHRSAPESTTSGGLLDRYGRAHSDLRISVTDRCNLRCVYCMPEEGMSFLPHAQLLTFDEIIRVARVARDLGVNSVRLTGGEPLVRKGLDVLVARLRELDFEDIALTTNAMHLAKFAPALVDAGLSRVNISCDSLREDRFATIRRRGELATVLHAMDVAETLGLTPLKVNVVLLRQRNDDEVLDFAAFARATGRIVRFIEFMPLDAQGEWGPEQLVTGREVFERINAVWPLEAVPEPHRVAPAERFRFVDGAGEIGLISPVSEPFCGTCNRLRLTADGTIRNCLFSDDEYSVRDVMRSGGSDQEIEQVLRGAVWKKFPGHAINEPEFLRPHRSMSMIGG